MSVTRNYFGDKGRDRPQFNYRGNDRNFTRNVPTSRHSIFIRGLPASINASTVKNFFADETRSSVSIDFVSYTDEHKKLCIAIRFESTQLARDMFTKYNNRELMGYNVEFSWYKDLKGAKGKFQDNRRFQNNYSATRQPRRFPERQRSRSKQRYRDSFEKRREYKSRSRSRDSVSSSSYSKSRSGSDSMSDRSSASPTRLIRDINREKRRKERDGESGDSYTSKTRKDAMRSDNEDEEERKKRNKSESCKLIEEATKFDRLLSSFESVAERDRAEDAVPTQAPSTMVPPPQPSSSSNEGAPPSVPAIVRRVSTEVLEEFSRDVERYLSVVNVLIGRNPDYEAPLVGSLKEILTEVGHKHVRRFVGLVEHHAAAATVVK